MGLPQQYLRREVELAIALSGRRRLLRVPSLMAEWRRRTGPLLVIFESSKCNVRGHVQCKVRL